MLEAELIAKEIEGVDSLLLACSPTGDGYTIGRAIVWNAADFDLEDNIDGAHCFCACPLEMTDTKKGGAVGRSGDATPEWPSVTTDSRHD